MWAILAGVVSALLGGAVGYYARDMIEAIRFGTAQDYDAGGAPEGGLPWVGIAPAPGPAVEFFERPGDRRPPSRTI